MAERRTIRGLRVRWNVGFMLTMLGSMPGGAAATELFKCGKTFQDRPCESAQVQQRFSRTQGTFSIEQVNPDTDKDCARAALASIGWWNRLVAGESLEQLKREIDGQNTSRYDKSRLRDALTELRGYRGNPTEVRSQFESQCMAYKRRHGHPTEREIASGAASLASSDPAPTPTEMRGSGNSQAAAMRAEAAARRAEVAARRSAIEAQRMAR
jgi:hypothetical protein